MWRALVSEQGHSEHGKQCREDKSAEGYYGAWAVDEPAVVNVLW